MSRQRKIQSKEALSLISEGYRYCGTIHLLGGALYNVFKHKQNGNKITMSYDVNKLVIRKNAKILKEYEFTMHQS